MDKWKEFKDSLSHQKESLDTLISNMDEAIEQKYTPGAGQLTESTKLLIIDLETAKNPKNESKVNDLIAKAKTERYHDFLGCEFSQMELACELSSLGLTLLCENVEDGKYNVQENPV